MRGFLKAVWTDLRQGRFAYVPRRVSYKLIQILGWQERFSALYCGARFYPFPSSLSRAIWLRREQFHRKDIQFLLDLLRPEDCLLDIGANIGTHAICPSKCVGESLLVYSFEPNPRVYEYLQKNIQLNRLTNIHTFNLALGDTEDSVVLHEESSDDTSWVDKVGSEGVEVPIKPLDALALDLQGRTTIVKMDIEGYELYALRGGEQTLQQAHVLCLEIGDRHSVRVGYTAQELMSYLAGQGWRLFRFETPTRMVEITPTYQPPDVESLVAVRSAELLQRRLPGYEVRIAQSEFSPSGFSPLVKDT